MIGNLSRGGSRQRRERYSKSILFRIINVKNILEALINVGCKEQGRQRAAATRQVAIGFQLENDYSCQVTVAATFGSFVTEVENYVTLYIALSQAESTTREKGAPFLFLSFPCFSFTLKIFRNLKKKI